MANTFVDFEDKHEDVINGAKYFFGVKKKEDAIKKILDYFHDRMVEIGWSNDAENNRKLNEFEKPIISPNKPFNYEEQRSYNNHIK